MSKPERGLPKAFSLRLPEGPIHLGDYLDESIEQAPASASIGESVVKGAIGKLPAIANIPPIVPPPTVTSPIEPAATDATHSINTTPTTAQPTVVAKRSAPPRRQFNMSSDTLRMLDDLIAHVRLHSQERDVRASEVVHALVLAAHEIRPHLDLSTVPPRGKWGSPNAAALPLALKKAFQDGIVRAADQRLSTRT